MEHCTEHGKNTERIDQLRVDMKLLIEKVNGMDARLVDVEKTSLVSAEKYNNMLDIVNEIKELVKGLSVQLTDKQTSDQTKMIEELNNSKKQRNFWIGTTITGVVVAVISALVLKFF